MWIWLRRPQTVLTALAGGILAFLVWYKAGGHDDGFDLAYVFQEPETMLYAAGALFFWAVGLADLMRAHLKRSQGGSEA